MPVEVWNGLFALIGTAITGYLALLAKRQSAQAVKSKENTARLADIQDKVNGNLEQRIREARWQANPQVLLIDDDINDLELMKRELEKLGTEVAAVQEVPKAFEMIRKRIGSGRGLPFDLVLVDLRLISTNAIEVIDMVDREAPWVPVVIITGALDLDLIQRAASRTPVTFVMKPLDRKMVEHLYRKYHIPFYAPEGRPKSDTHPPNHHHPSI